MKIMILLLISGVLYAGEFTGAGQELSSLLQARGLSISKLQNDGHQIIVGEFTGAGREIEVDRIRYFSTAKAIYPQQEVIHYQYKYPSDSRSFGDLLALEVQTKNINAREIRAIIFK